MEAQKMVYIYNNTDNKYQKVNYSDISNFFEERIVDVNSSEVLVFMVKKATKQMNLIHNHTDYEENLCFDNVSEINSLLFVIKDICHRFFEFNSIGSRKIPWEYVANIDLLIDKIHNNLFKLHKEKFHPFQKTFGP